MKPKHPDIIIFCARLVLLGLTLSACSLGGGSHPATALQNMLAAQLENSDVCPGGNSKDVQQMVNAAGADGVTRLPEACYQINSTINLPPCTQLIGAGADKTILYRDPKGNYSGPILQVIGKADTQCATQISGVALIGVRDTDDTGQDYGLKISSLRDFRVDHVYFEGFGFAGVRLEGSSSGVIDHAIFVDNFKRGIDNLGYGVVVYGKGTWDSELQPGGAQATFMRTPSRDIRIPSCLSLNGARPKSIRQITRP
ncbi:MAG: hypothetical protein WAV05_06970 [Anaerolineales bacterium]